MILNSFLEECKYIIKERKMSKYITGNIEIPSDSDRGDSDEGNSNKENSDEETKKKLIKIYFLIFFCYNHGKNVWDKL